MGCWPVPLGPAHEGSSHGSLRLCVLLLQLKGHLGSLAGSAEMVFTDSAGLHGEAACPEGTLADALAPAAREQRVRPLHPILHTMRRSLPLLTLLAAVPRHHEHAVDPKRTHWLCVSFPGSATQGV